MPLPARRIHHQVRTHGRHPAHLHFDPPLPLMDEHPVEFHRQHRRHRLVGRQRPPLHLALVLFHQRAKPLRHRPHRVRVEMHAQILGHQVRPLAKGGFQPVPAHHARQARTEQPTAQRPRAIQRRIPVPTRRTVVPRADQPARADQALQRPCTGAIDQPHPPRASRTGRRGPGQRRQPQPGQSLDQRPADAAKRLLQAAFDAAQRPIRQRLPLRCQCGAQHLHCFLCHDPCLLATIHLYPRAGTAFRDRRAVPRSRVWPFSLPVTLRHISSVRPDEGGTPGGAIRRVY